MDKLERIRAKEKRKEEQGPVICLFLEHGSRGNLHSIYLIKPCLDDFKSKISPALIIPNPNRNPEMMKFLTASASANLGSKMYFFGGFHSNGVVNVQAFDTENPNLGIYSVSSMNSPKETPCVFVADNMIYALGCCIDKTKRFSSKGIGIGFDLDATGCFERYNPITDTWQVLPDPPVHLPLMSAVSVVGRSVFIGPSSVIFNLDSLEWDAVLPPSFSIRFPYGSLYAQDQHSLYYLRGQEAFDLLEFCQPQRFRYGEPIQVAKRGPLPSPLPDSNITLLKAPCFDPAMEQIVAPPEELLDPNVFFDHQSFEPWRRLFHMGGRFFCYVVTAQLIDMDSNTMSEPYSRGVWIKFFEEVEVPSQGFQFRTLASFCYEINTKFKNNAQWVRGCVLGSIPQSWIKDPPGNKVQESKLMRHKKFEAVIKEDPTGSGNLLKLLAVREKEIAVKEKEIRRMAAELSRKDEALKAKETF